MSDSPWAQERNEHYSAEEDDWLVSCPLTWKQSHSEVDGPIEEQSNDVLTNQISRALWSPALCANSQSGKHNRSSIKRTRGGGTVTLGVKTCTLIEFVQVTLRTAPLTGG